MRSLSDFLVLLVISSPALAFHWGAATAAFQIEGGVNHGGRLPSVWDNFSHTPGKIANGDTADVADNSYYRFKHDARLAKKIGLTAYRFSLSWSRIIPRGKGPVNQIGIDHYNQVIDNLIEQNITPFVTLFHWDTPLALEEDIGGWLSPEMVQHFSRYAAVCFQAFGDRVKHWITINEPKTLALCGYCYGNHAPGRCSSRDHCAQGNSSFEPFIVGHNLLLAHAAAASIYRARFQQEQKGQVGISLNADFAYPRQRNLSDDIKAAQRNIEFSMGWFADPIHFGRYPVSMTERVGFLPVFTEADKERLIKSIDFFGSALNSYTAKYISHSPRKIKHNAGDFEDSIQHTTDTLGQLIGPQAGSSWLQVVPNSLHDMLLWVSERYNYPRIFVTENGVSDPVDQGESVNAALNDNFRIKFFEGDSRFVVNSLMTKTCDTDWIALHLLALLYAGYLAGVMNAMQKGVKVDGYFAWSLIDNFEWDEGYRRRFGLFYVDFKRNQQRIAKKSAYWFKEYIATHTT